MKKAGIFDLLCRMKFDLPNDDESAIATLREKIAGLFSEIEKRYDISPETAN